jgi:hypothetical protein
MNNSTRLKSAVILLALLLLSCDNNRGEPEFADCSLEGPDFSIADLSGNWKASDAVVQLIPPGSTKDIVADGGTVQLFVDSSGSFTLLVHETNRKSEDFTGKFSFCDGNFYAVYDDDPDKYEEYDPVFDGVQLFYYGPTDYDYDGDGVEEGVSIAFTFTRE